MKLAIIIPARFASTRFPGKPLALINGKAMIDHVYELALEAAKPVKNSTVIVATDDDRIENHCKTMGHTCLRTSENCKTGSDRVLEAAIKLSDQPDVVINLQGDAPLTPLVAMERIIRVFTAEPDVQVATPIRQLSWDELNRLKRKKKLTPFSGTTAVVGKNGQAKWFSKHIIPAIRNEEDLMQEGDMSPVFQHLGLYGYRLETLKKFVNLSEGTYEALEGLEQLRFLENDIPVQCVEIPTDTLIHSGIDSPEDVDSAESTLRSMRMYS
ncbi:MAG: 3-deoxy-manno-octulosonate cytidylyltransferase [Alphaproteobacteria bacterium]|nr:MAG: 3-deoxy-manno-octulosonate cytidylyltransferase [Alphaproteobacteria bacterium]